MNMTALLLIMLWGCGAFAADWPSFRGNDQRSGYSSEKVAFPSKDSAWSVRLGGPVVSSPSLAGGTLYIGCRDSCVYALSTVDGAVRWKKKTGGWVDASPLIAGETVYAPGRDNVIRVLDAAAGDSVSSLRAGLQISSPALYGDDWLLSGVGPPDNAFTAFNLRHPDSSWSIFFPQFCYSSPAVSGTDVLIGNGDGQLYCISVPLRKIRWSLPTIGGVYLSSPSVRDSIAYFAPGDDDRNVYAIKISNGAVLWAGTGSASVKNQTTQASLPSDGALLQELRSRSPADRAAGIALLKKQGVATAQRLSLAKQTAGPVGFLPLEGGVKTSSPAVDGSHVYVVQREQGYSSDISLTPLSRFTLVALDSKTGKHLWSFTDVTSALQLGYNSSPVVADGKVVFGWGDGHLFVCGAHDGAMLWADTLRGAIAASPAIADGRLFVATLDGWLYGFRLRETPSGKTFAQSTYCFPNPVSGPVSHVQVYVQRQASLSMTIFSMADQPVAHISRQLHAGEKFRYDWNVSGVANGVYFARILVQYSGGGEDRKTVKIAVLK